MKPPRLLETSSSRLTSLPSLAMPLNVGMASGTNMERDLSDLTFGLTFAFLAPIVCYATGMAWNKMVRASAKQNRIWTSICLLLPIIGLGMMVQVGWSSLRRLWIASPYFMSLLILILGVIAPATLIAIVMRLWRSAPSHHDRM